MSWKWLTLGFLGICTVTDLQKRQIWWPLSVLFLTAAAAIHFIRGDVSAGNLAAGIILGGGCLFTSWFTREAIGYGDGLVIAACGASLGFAGIFQVLLLAVFFSALWSIYLLLSKRAGRKDTFPFLPFLLAAQCCVMVVEII